MIGKILKGILVVAAVLIALAYTFGYDYLFKAVRETYLRGETGSSTADGIYFPSHVITKGVSKPWQTDSRYNKQALSKTLVKELEESKTSSFLIIKDGKILHEQYWNGNNSESLTNSFSMAKAVTVMLVGKALEEKKIKSLDQPYSDFFRNYSTLDLGKHLTLAHLAKMEAGLYWKEDYKNPFLPNAKAYYGKSLEEAVLLRGFKTKPGSTFEYQSGATQLLGFALRKSLPGTIAEYASKKLWQPLGMEQNATWNTDEAGMEKTFCCINGTTRDFAKLGYLFLNKGNFAGQQILTEEFLVKMQTPTPLSAGAYGLGLWINNDAAVKHYYFWGLYGQYIIVVPEKNMVIVRTGMYKDQPFDAKGRPQQAADLVRLVAESFD